MVLFVNYTRFCYNHIAIYIYINIYIYIHIHTNCTMLKLYHIMFCDICVYCFYPVVICLILFNYISKYITSLCCIFCSSVMYFAMFILDCIILLHTMSYYTVVYHIIKHVNVSYYLTLYVHVPCSGTLCYTRLHHVCCFYPVLICLVLFNYISKYITSLCCIFCSSVMYFAMFILDCIILLYTMSYYTVVYHIIKHVNVSYYLTLYVHVPCSGTLCYTRLHHVALRFDVLHDTTFLMLVCTASHHAFAIYV